MTSVLPSRAMSLRPVVGITLRPQESDGLPRRYAQNRAYIDALVEAGAVPLGIPPLEDEAGLHALYSRCDAILLPGGPDVEPRLYGEDPIPDCHVRSVPQLDAADMALAHWALEDRLPLLGICRGVQVLNVALGGSLWQDVAVQGGLFDGHDADSRTELVHEVDVDPDSVLAGVLDATHLRWNSIHHQGLRRLGEGLVSVARAHDGLVEGVELPGMPVLGVQCHPEELVATQPWARGVMRWLVERAAAPVVPAG